MSGATSPADAQERMRKIDRITRANEQRGFFRSFFQSLGVFHWAMMPSLSLCLFCLLW